VPARLTRRTSHTPGYAGAIGTLVVVLGLLAGCGASESEGDPKLTIYVSAPLTGLAADEGRDVADGAKLALSDAGGEAAGLPIKAVVLDVAEGGDLRWDPVAAGDNARSATEDSTSIAYIGELDSAAARTSVPITNSAGLLQVAPGSGATDLVVAESFDDSVPEEIQATGERTFARVLPSDRVVAEALGAGLISGPVEPSALPAAAGETLGRFEKEFGRAAGPWVAYGYEAMASVLAAVERAEDPLSRASVVAAYFGGPERESILGPYRITEEGESSLTSPLAGYRIAGDRLVGPVEQAG
jgi:ABC-type branched-subunit amino acid transport system substrate-binding protein